MTSKQMEEVTQLSCTGLAYAWRASQPLYSYFIERQLDKAVALASAKLVYLALQQVAPELCTELGALGLCA